MPLTWDEIESMRPAREWHLPLPPTCRKCGYNLTGLDSNRCPECGREFKWKEVRLRTARIWSLTLRLRHANEDAMLGLKLAGGGLLFYGLALLTQSLVVIVIAKICGFVASVLSVVLGSQVLNLRRVPVWARPYASKPPPNLPLGVLTMGLGLLLMLVSLLLA